jgi:hypothetical protein
MNLPKKFCLVLAAVAASCLVRADEPAIANTSVGTIGQRYLELNFTDQVIEHISKNYYYVGAGANLPVTPFLDLNGSYSYGWFKLNNQNLHSNLGEISTTAYVNCAGMKPFVTADVGYQWDRTTAVNYFVRSDYGVWGGAVGVEIPVGAVALSPFASYADDFRRSPNSSQDLAFGVKANYWFNRHWAVFADLHYEDVMHSTFDSFNWSFGLRRKF